MRGAGSDEAPVPKLTLQPVAQDRLVSRELEAPVPSDFPGKKAQRSAQVVVKGDFEPDAHFYARCRTLPFCFVLFIRWR